MGLLVLVLVSVRLIHVKPRLSKEPLLTENHLHLDSDVWARRFCKVRGIAAATHHAKLPSQGDYASQ